jgi:hypothetical protein
MDIYNIEYKRALKAQYDAQNQPAEGFTVDPDDLETFLRLCRRYNMTTAEMFHSLLRTCV